MAYIKNAPLIIGLVTDPTDGSANDTIAVRSGWAVSTSKALLPITHVSA